MRTSLCARSPLRPLATRDTVVFIIHQPGSYWVLGKRMKYPITIITITITAILSIIVPMAATAQSDPRTGKEIFEQMCAGCHGTQGNGQEGTKSGFVPRIGTLANKEYMAQVPDDYLVLVIKKGGAYMGKIAAMPAWEKRLSDDDVRRIVAHIRTF